ncbi:SDR family NAD(P)-dependent oxidoreductase [Rhizobium leguminosarum]|uniref:SDR family NAD(P)-dependent oxidoreductase n=1 Tax=Rhizobium leguminosarum TaxID=384 RepID=UPI001C97A38E|nr:SDR family oxidoreductase [Rhizobium leguminosarum]MBY5406776.1 SDR family oxidoreductase [Rhizobium leguminosarum]
MPELRHIDQRNLAVFPSLRGCRVFVTGGGTGIGAAIVEAFAAQGAHTAFVDIADAESRALVDRIASVGCPAPWFRKCDVRDVSDLQAAIREAAAALGEFQVLVNNVASDDRHVLEAVDEAYWNDRMAINQRPSFFAIQAVVPSMKRLGGGSIINLGSLSWHTKNPGFPCYTVAKSSVNGLTRGLAASLGKDRIRINTVSPGWVMTSRQLSMWLDADGETNLRNAQCLPDLLQSEDIARMVLFLAADDSQMCTAQEFIIDGGLS